MGQGECGFNGPGASAVGSAGENHSRISCVAVPKYPPIVRIPLLDVSMNRLLVGRCFCALAFCFLVSPAFGQESDPPLPPGEVPEVTVSEQQTPSRISVQPGEQYEVPPELKEEADKAVAEFKRLRDEMEAAIGQQREMHILYLNDIDRSPAAAKRYREQRDKVRSLMDETFVAALDVFRYMPDQVAAQFLATMIQHREKQNIYNYETAEGATMLIEAGMRYRFLFLAAARSAVVVGRFETARRLYEALEGDQDQEMSREDIALYMQLEEFEKAFGAEKELIDKEAEEDRLPRVKLKTTRGDVVLELFIDSAPSTVANFIQLVDDGFYNELDFYQVIDNTLALTGDPGNGAGTGSGRYLIDEHTRPDARKAFRGSLVMTKIPMGESGNFFPNSASSQFAILFLPMSRPSQEQTIFGRVIEGMEVVSTFRRVNPAKEKEKTAVQLPPDRIITAEVIRRPEKLPKPVYVQVN